MERNGIVKLTILVALALLSVAVIVSIFVNGTRSSQSPSNDQLVFEVVQGEFVSSVNETGDIESSSNVEIRCEVKSRGKAGTAVLTIIPEGTMVQEGDFICQLDDSVLKDELTTQKISVAEDRAMVIQATSDLDTARRSLKEYENGLYEQERNTLRALIATAQETFRRSSEFRRHSELLARKGYRTKTQLDADVFAETKAELELELATQNLAVYEKFTRERMTAELKAEIAKQEANVEATEFTMQLSESRLKEIQEEIQACRIQAPVDGMVVYANEIDRRGDASFVIEEGALIRDGQPIVRLPDPKNMQVRTKVNDSKINQVEPGQDCLIRVDTDPENPIAGKVSRVSSFPMPRRWYQAPIEYEVFVEVTEDSPLIRSGLRAKTEIFVERLDNVIQAPLTSLVKNDNAYFVFVKNEGQIDARQVQIGSNNDKFIVIKEGLNAGEQVLVDADNYKTNFEFPPIGQP